MMKLLEHLLAPAKLPYNFEEWKTLSFGERAHKVCLAWAIQGFGAPFSTAVFYIIKIAIYIAIWFYFCSFSTELGSFSTIGEWWFKIEALSKAIVWTTLLEVIGFGGASGPLTGRYIPPLGGITYFLRRKTIKVPLFLNTPIIGKDSRGLLDIVLYLGLIISLIRLCISTEIIITLLLPVVILYPILGILDRTVYLAGRADIYYPMLICLLFPLESANGLKLMWFGIWFWAAFSKLTPNFPSVVCVMICNSPVLNFKVFEGFKKKLFKEFPNDLRPSQFAKKIGHMGTFVEFVMPICLLLFANNPTITFYAIIIITAFHFFIFMNFPMGVPMEWNVIMVYGGWVLFIMHPEVAAFQITELMIIITLVISLLLLPILGNLFPKHISFLLSMRYYAGTWGYSLWLFKGNAKEKIDQKLFKSSKSLVKQLQVLYDMDTINATLSRIIAFRLMHLPGRLLHELLPKAVDNLDDYLWRDGEFIAGEVVGWNFGDMHLHHDPLMNAIQKRCNYQSGELRVITVESPQFHTQKLSWKIFDAKDGLLEQGVGNIKVLQDQLPWPNYKIKE